MVLITLTPLDIHNKEFSKSFRGYNKNEVNKFLEKVVKDYEETIKRNIELKEKVEQLNNKIEHYQNMEDTLHNAIVVAQQTAESVKENANKEAELIKKEAEEESEKMIREANEEVKKVERNLMDLKNQANSFKIRLKSMIRSQLDMLDIDSWELTDDSEDEVVSEDSIASETDSLTVVDKANAADEEDEGDNF